MGHKGNNKFSGARGRKEPREVMRRVNADDQAALDVLAEAHDADIRELARAHCPEAVKTLNHLMRARRTPPSVKRQCARDLIEIGHGRVGTRDAGDSAPSGLTINIVSLSGSEHVEVKTITPQALAVERKRRVEEASEVPEPLAPDWEPEVQTVLATPLAEPPPPPPGPATHPTAASFAERLAVRQALQRGQWPPPLRPQ